MSGRNHLILALVGVVIMTFLWEPVSAHGRLLDPPARGTMWRLGYNTPVNVNDNQMFCGGFIHQMDLGYKCGVCGDAFDLEKPRPNEAGGLYATGIITAEYIQGQRVDVKVQVTANHLGWFTFKICPTANHIQEATQECFDQNLLQLADEPGTKYYVGTRDGVINIPVLLPEDLVCNFCTLQWRYHTGNSWGVDPDGTSCLGCGYQEEFYGCADIKIASGVPEATTTAPAPESTTTEEITTTLAPETTPTKAAETTTTSAPETTPTKAAETTTTSAPETTPTTAAETTTTTPAPTPSPVSSFVPTIYNCSAGSNALITWCNDNCNWIPRNCPASLCQCQEIQEPRLSTVDVPGCYAKTPFYVRAQTYDAWCHDNCALGNCPENICFCIYTS